MHSPRAMHHIKDGERHVNLIFFVSVLDSGYLYGTTQVIITSYKPTSSSLNPVLQTLDLDLRSRLNLDSGQPRS